MAQAHGPVTPIAEVPLPLTEQEAGELSAALRLGEPLLGTRDARGICRITLCGRLLAVSWPRDDEQRLAVARPLYRVPYMGGSRDLAVHPDASGWSWVVRKTVTVMAAVAEAAETLAAYLDVPRALVYDALQTVPQQPTMPA